MEVRTPIRFVQDEILSDFVSIIRHRAQTQTSDTAFIWLKNGETEEGSLSYEKLDLNSRAIAAWLQAQGFEGQRVILLYQSALEFICAFFGCLYAGVIAVPANPPRENQKKWRVRAIVENAEAVAVLTSPSLLNNIQTRVRDDSGQVNPDCYSTGFSEAETESLAAQWQHPAINDDSIAFLQYTSGSTGTPKGVAVSHGNLVHNQKMIKMSFNHNEDTVFVGWLPLYHDMGLVGNVLQPLYLGIPCILMSPDSFIQKPVRWLRAISRYGATTSGGPNFAYDLCARRITPEQLEGVDLSKWKVAFNGSEPVRAETLERFNTAFEPYGFRREAFYPCYGMSEATLFVTGGLHNSVPKTCAVDAEKLARNRVKEINSQFANMSELQDVRYLVSSGKSWLDLKVCVVDPQSLVQCAEGEVGEIWIAGPSVAKGYWRNPVATALAFRAYISDTKEGPFFRTGDLGFLLDGEIFVTGRSKDIIIINGRNHYPQDIEMSVAESHPAFSTVSGAAFTIEVNGEEQLVVVQEVARTYIRKVDLTELEASIRHVVAMNHGLHVKKPVLVKPASLPKTSSGKIQRHACRIMFLNGTLKTLSINVDERQGLLHEVNT